LKFFLKILTLIIFISFSGCLKPAFQKPPYIEKPAEIKKIPLPDTAFRKRKKDFFRVKKNSVRVFLAHAESRFKLILNGKYAVYSESKNFGLLQGEISVYIGEKGVFLGSIKENLKPSVNILTLNQDALFSLNGKTYRGNLIIRYNAQNRLILINEVRIEDYLKGVIPYEMGKRDSIHFEALKVQAIAARTYTYSRFNMYADNGFDVYPDVSDQVYNGTQSEYSLASKAVDLTRDIVITHADTLIHAYYFSTSSGKTANIEEVWPDKGYKPYLRSVEDSSFNTTSKYFFWKEKWSGAAFERIINLYLRNFFGDFKKGRLFDITIEEYTTSGRVKTLSVTVAGRTYRLYGDKVRWLLRRNIEGYPILLSAFFNLNVEKGPLGIKKVIADGRGYGHGVGLSQIGALEMAKAGKKFEEIIQKYYTKVKLIEVIY